MDLTILPRPKRGRPKNEDGVKTPPIKTPPIPSIELSLQENAYQMMTYYQDPFRSYVRAGATQFSAMDSIKDVFNILLNNKQIHFSGLPMRGDIVFFSKNGVLAEVAMISRLDIATNKLFVVKAGQDPLETYPVDAWYAFGKIVR